MSNPKYQKQKRNNRIGLVISIIVCLLLIALVVMVILLALYGDKSEWHDKLEETPILTDVLGTISSSEQATEALSETSSGNEAAPSPESMQTETPITESNSSGTLKEDSFDPRSLKETDIYAFLQGPKAWASRADFSGSWCHIVLCDQEFSVFGCGLCDLAGIYSTLTPYECSPVDMYYYAQEVSNYRPVSGYGAIDWPYLKQTLAATGITAKLHRKGLTYEKFQERIASGIAAIALISSGYDDTYWHDVSGHYVLIWLYDPSDDTVFLNDSGNPDHNRQRIPLRYVYDALLVSSSFQYLVVTDVDPDGNTWQHDGIKERWKRPVYMRKTKR